jgi:hypothetical protein
MVLASITSFLLYYGAQSFYARCLPQRVSGRLTIGIGLLAA